MGQQVGRHGLEADEPESVLGTDLGANAAEALLHGLASCLNTTFIYYAAAEGVHIDELELEGDIDLRGILGIDPDVPNGFQHIAVTFNVKSDAPRETVEELVELAQRRSPVLWSVTHPVPVTVSYEAL